MLTRYAYKAKTLDKGEWIIGNRIEDTINEIVYIVPFGTEINKETNQINLVEVDPDTVCQYTEFRDKNKTPVWEEDVIRAYIEVDKGVDGKQKISKEYVTYVCHYDPFNHEFVLSNDEESFSISYMNEKDIEVIGNRIDRPRLK